MDGWRDDERYDPLGFPAAIQMERFAIFKGTNGVQSYQPVMRTELDLNLSVCNV
jgi:hypothetical protein